MSAPLIIGLTGPAGSGKDTAAAYMERRYSFLPIAFASPLKRALAAMGFEEPFNRDLKEATLPDFDFSYRKAAQTLGTEWGRSLDPNLWVKLAMRQIKEPKPYVFTDVRFDNEAEIIRAAGGRIWHVIGRKADLGDRASHASENGVLFYPAQDELLDNSGNPFQLYNNIDKLLENK